MNARMSTANTSMSMINMADAIEKRRALTDGYNLEGSAFSRGFFKALEAVTWLVTYPTRRATLAELRGLSDRELADVGLTRADVSGVFALYNVRQR